MTDYFVLRLVSSYALLMRARQLQIKLKDGRGWHPTDSNRECDLPSDSFEVRVHAHAAGRTAHDGFDFAA